MANEYIIKRGTSKANAFGTWWKDADGSVTVKCPKCGGIGTLFIPGDPESHDIDATGIVHPSLDCPRKSCKFHEMVALEQWRADG